MARVAPLVAGSYQILSSSPKLESPRRPAIEQALGLLAQNLASGSAQPKFTRLPSGRMPEGVDGLGYPSRTVNDGLPKTYDGKILPINYEAD